MPCYDFIRSYAISIRAYSFSKVGTKTHFLTAPVLIDVFLYVKTKFEEILRKKIFPCCESRKNTAILSKKHYFWGFLSISWLLVVLKYQMRAQKIEGPAHKQCMVISFRNESYPAQQSQKTPKICRKNTFFGIFSPNLH